MNKETNITFYLPSLDQICLLRDAHPEKDFHLFSTGSQVWIGQTYLRLKMAGYPVTLTNELPSSGIVIAHSDHISNILRQRSLISDLMLVAVRADRPARFQGDHEVVQNRYSASDARSHYIQHWPQPGLIIRDVSRKNRVENVAFKGVTREMLKDFSTPSWEKSLNEQNIKWHADASTFTHGSDQNYQVNWNDYSTTDLIVAIRNNLDHTHTRKPASKLINAWLAGVPAILGPEQAYRELRTNEYDYIEAASASEAMAAILRLKNNPKLYEAMVDNARERALSVTTERCTEQWARLLFDILPQKRNPAPFSILKLFYKSMRSHLSSISSN